MKMKFWAIILPIIVCLFSCQSSKKENQYITFSGHLKNASFDSVYIVLNEREKGFALDFDGNFSDTLQLTTEGYNKFSLDREEFTLYLIPGDSLFFNGDLKQLDRTYYFKGKGADRNNYLFEKDTLINAWVANEDLYRLSPEGYITNITDFSNTLKTKLRESQLESSFIKIENKNLYFDEFNLMYGYRDSYAYFNPTKPQLPIKFLEFKKFNLDNADDFDQFQSYRSIVNYYLDEQLNSGHSPIDILKSIESENIKYSFIRSLIDSLDPKDQMSHLYYQAIQKFCKYKPWLEEADNIMNKS